MRNVYRALAYLLAAEVIVQGMAIAYALAAMGHWVDEDGGVVNKALFDQDNPKFPGSGGFMLHGINGTAIIPLILILLVITSFFAKVPDGTRRALILFGMVAVQVVLGIGSHDVPWLAPLHVLNAFGIVTFAYLTARRVGSVATEPVAA